MKKAIPTQVSKNKYFSNVTNFSIFSNLHAVDCSALPGPYYKIDIQDSLHKLKIILMCVLSDYRMHNVTPVLEFLKNNKSPFLSCS